MAKIPVKISDKGRFLAREVVLTRIGTFLTLLVSLLLSCEIVRVFLKGLHEGYYKKSVEEVVFAVIVLFFIYGNLVYQFTRAGYLKRFLRRRPVPTEVLDRIYENPAPSLTFLIPSYKEETRVIKETLLSAALQEYPNRRVVLLIDDPPNSVNTDDLIGLRAARRLPKDIQKLLDKPRKRLLTELAGFIERKALGLSVSEEYSNLAGLYCEVAEWFEDQANYFDVTDHADRWFVEKILREPARKHLRRAKELLNLVEHRDDPQDESAILREYTKLASLFDTELTSFERKRYENLSHELSKAMNLNSYISLMGKSFRQVEKNGAVYIEQVEPAAADFAVPDAQYLITLDADSLLMPGYATRLVHVMEKPGNERCAVVQTPYNAIPNSPGVLERIAGATTDIQYIIHQGFTFYGATFWVGANALLRKAALDDISATVEERGFKMTRYIQDRTVIEDTESSVDLIQRGWTLFNYPDRLSYSATPPDFGALLIQRRRWANGGLIILPKLLRYLFSDMKLHKRLREGLNRIHYLTSLAGVNAGLLLILLYPFEPGAHTVVCLSLLFFINFLLYGRDLVQSGYRYTDLFRIYALNLMLIPINLGGVIKSLHQAWTGQKIPFKRTPKITSRTTAPASYVIAEFVIFFISVTSCLVHFISGKLLYASFAFVNSIFFVYIIRNYLGFRESREDLLDWWVMKRPRLVGALSRLHAVFLVSVIFIILLLTSTVSIGFKP
jgi:cellulose synthase (UDP-forming)